MKEDNFDQDVEDLLPRPDLETTLAALHAASGKTVSSTLVYGLSDLEPEQIDQVRPVWESLPTAQRRRIMRTLADASETDFEQDYGVFARFALADLDADVRGAAIDALWDNEDLATLNELLQLAQNDPSLDVRAAAFSSLGRFILLGELDDLPIAAAERVREVAFRVWCNSQEDIDVRRRALEAFANSSDDRVIESIEQAYQHEDRRMQISAVFAMGKSCDERWSDHVLKELEATDAAMQYEAARAAGELELEDAIPQLKALAFGDDVDIRDAAIWSLGEIGGREAVRALELLAKEAKQRGDDDLLAAIEDAIASASLGDDDLYLFKLGT